MPDVSTLPSVAELRGAIFAKGKADRDDFVRALEWNGADSPDYRQLLADVAVDLFIDQADPPQYISIESADWLIARIKAHALSYAAKIRLLSALMQYAVSLPSSLSSFLLGEIEAAIVDGRPGHPAGRLDADDVEALRRAFTRPTTAPRSTSRAGRPRSCSASRMPAPARRSIRVSTNFSPRPSAII